MIGKSCFEKSNTIIGKTTQNIRITHHPPHKFNGSGEPLGVFHKKKGPNLSNLSREQVKCLLKDFRTCKALAACRNSKFTKTLETSTDFRRLIHGMRFTIKINTNSFNQLDLPLYESYESLRTNLLTSISECGTGFGFA